MPCNEKVECDGLVEPSQTPLHEICQYIFVLVLPTAVITVEIQIFGTQGVVLEEVVEIRDHSIGALATTM